MKSYLSIILFAIVILYSGSGFAISKNIVIAVFGDSVTRGVWANSKIGNPGLDFYLSAHKALKRLNKLTPTQLALINHPEIDLMRYTRLMESKFGFTSRNQLSGAAGNQGYSFGTRLSAYTSMKVNVINVGLLAGSYQYGKAQLSQLKRKLAGRKPDYILVNFTVIDALSGSSPEMFKDYVARFFKILTHRYPRSKIIVTPLTIPPSISTLSDKISVPAFMGGDAYTCGDIQQLAYGLFNSDTSHMIGVRQKTQEMNGVLVEELSVIQKGLSPYDTFGGKLIITETPGLEHNNWEDYLAADCVHPNLKGQEIIGNLLWDAFLSQLSSVP